MASKVRVDECEERLKWPGCSVAKPGDVAVCLSIRTRSQGRTEVDLLLNSCEFSLVIPRKILRLTGEVNCPRVLKVAAR